MPAPPCPGRDAEASDDNALAAPGALSIVTSMPSPVLCRALALALALSPIPLLAGRAAPNTAADSVTRLGGAETWDAYSDIEKGHKICYVVGAPSKTEPSDARRAKIYASITHRPAEKVTDEVSFNAGYLFKDGSDAELAVDGRKFSLFTNKDSAWARDSATDKAVVAALAKGKQAVIKGVSARGTATTDTYSLTGLGEALGEIDKACGVKH
jgi:hypothetical protein